MKYSIGCSLAVVVLVTLTFATRVANAQTLEPVSALRVVDANNKKVGDALSDLDGGYQASVAFTVNGRLFLVTAYGDGFESDSVDYESSDCSGTPYRFWFPDLAQRSSILPPGQTVYLPDPNPTPISITVGSFWELNTNGAWSCQPVQQPQTQDGVVPLQPVIDLSTQFTPPFRLVPSSATPTAQCCGDCNGDGQVTISEIITGVNNALNGCPTP